MKIFNDNNELIISFQVYKDRDIYKSDLLKPILEYRRSMYLTGCPAEYQHLVDIPEWYIIEDYHFKNDNEYNALFTIADSRNRMVLLKASLIEENDLDPQLFATVTMEGSHDLLLLYPPIYESEISYLSQIIAGDIYKREKVAPMEITRFQEYIYDDNFINNLIIKKICIPVTRPMKKDVDSTDKGIIIRDLEDGGRAKWLPVKQDPTGALLVRLADKEEFGKDILLLGDIVRYQSNTCIIVSIDYAVNASALSTEEHLVDLVNVKTGSSFRVAMVEIRNIKTFY